MPGDDVFYLRFGSQVVRKIADGDVRETVHLSLAPLQGESKGKQSYCFVSTVLTSFSWLKDNIKHGTSEA